MAFDELDSIEQSAFWGSLLSLIFCVVIILRFYLIPSLRRYPAWLLINKTVLELLSSALVIGQVMHRPARGTLATDSSFCTPYSFAFQYCWIGAELWFGAMSVNLWKSIQSPFAVPAANTKRAIVFVNLVALGTAALVAGTGGGRSAFRVCYVPPRGDGAQVNWVVVLAFYIPLLINWIVSLCVAVFAVIHLSKSLRQSFQAKRREMVRERNSILFYSLYWGLTGLLYLVALLDEHKSAKGQFASSSHVAVAFTFLFMSKAIVSLLLSISEWCMCEDKRRPPPPFTTKSRPLPSPAPEASEAAGTTSEENADSLLLNVALQRELVHCLRLGLTCAVTSSSSGGDGWCDVHLSELALPAPDLGMNSPPALVRQSTVPSVFTDIARQMISRPSRLSESNSAHSLTTRPSGVMELQSSPSDPLLSVEEAPTRYDSVHNSEQPFEPPPLAVRQLAPLRFRSIRSASGVDEAEFAGSFQTTVKHSFSEGASGALMCFSSNQKYVIKAVSPDDMEVLEDIIGKYDQYVNTHRGTFLIRFLMCVEIKLYTNRMWFVVMNNIFPVGTGITIHERYDLKGSWVNRSSTSQKLDKPRVCRNCHKRFTVNRTQCSAGTTTRHEFDIVWKDLDFKMKLTVPPEEAEAIKSQLRLDSEFLRDQEIMDYSLLIGVHRTTRTLDRDLLRAELYTRSGPVAGPEVAHPGVLGSAPHESSRVYIPCEHDTPVLFYFGVIDILQRWTWSKRLERFAKIMFRCVERAGLSAVQPAAYQARFRDRVIDMVVRDPTPHSEDSPVRRVLSPRTVSEQ